MDLSASLSDLKLKSCILNASGALCMSSDELLELDKSNSGGIITKTCTIYTKEGNPRPRYYHDENISLNSMGLPNMSYEEYAKCADRVTKPYIVSVAGDVTENVINILEQCIAHPKINGVELNISCPNICSADKILGYHFDELEKFLSSIHPQILKLNETNKPIGIKLPPYFEPYQFKIISQIVGKYNFNFVTTINSVPNCLVIDTETEMPVIKPKNGIGGLGGRYIKYVVLSNIYQLRKHLKDEIQIIGCGGIMNGEDVFQHLLAGASLVQIGTVLMQEGTSAFDRIERELIEIMKKKNYSCLKDFTGKLKPHDSSLFVGKHLY